MKEIRLCGKIIYLDECPVLMDYKPEENYLDKWMIMKGDWEYKDGWLIGTNPGNYGGILYSRERFDCDVIFSFTAKTVLPATRDVNAVFCSNWNEEKNYLGKTYIVGLNGWYEHKSGIEREAESGGLFSLTNAYQYTPGAEVRITTGSVNGHCFLFADGVFVTELNDPNYISGGHVGFSPYSTKLAVKDIEVRRAVWHPFRQTYEPEF